MGCVASKPTDQVTSCEQNSEPPTILDGPNDVAKTDCLEEPAKPIISETAEQKPAVHTAVERAVVDGKLFKRGDQYCVFVGGNYVMKGAPYFPSLEIVQKNAKMMHESWEKMKYKPPDYLPPGSDETVTPFEVTALPCVRLGCMFEGAMPDQKGVWDPQWQANLKSTVAAFADYGIYVFLDVHQDALSTTNGGEGMPWWVGDYMQKTASWGEWYVVTPEMPLELCIPGFLESALRLIGVDLPRIRTAPEWYDPNPWHAFSIGSGMPPSKMNVGNLSMRYNTVDSHWGDVICSRQVQTYAYRLWNCHKYTNDRENIFAPWIVFVKFLCTVWQEYTNVVAVEMINEPPLTGLPNILFETWPSRRDLFDFYAATMEELEKDGFTTPVALEDLFGACPGSNPNLNILQGTPISWNAMEKLKDWASKSRLIFSVHHYPGLAATVSFEESLALAREEADRWGGVPVWLSEFHAWQPDTVANAVAVSINKGAAASTFWHYCDPEETGTWGWYKYPWKFPIDKASTQLVKHNGDFDKERWEEYVKTIYDPDGLTTPTVWGAMITGANGGQRCNLLELLPEVTEHVHGLLAKTGQPPPKALQRDPSP